MRRDEQRAHAASELMLLGNTLYTQGDTLGAVIAYRRAARLAPPAKRAVVRLMLGLVLAELGDLRAAQRALRRAARAEDQIIADRARRTLAVITSDSPFSPPRNLVRAPDIELLDRLARETKPAADRPEPAKQEEAAVGADTAGTGENNREPWAQAAVIARMLGRFENDVGNLAETAILLKLATRFTRFARYRDRHGQPYRRAGRHRCWTIRHPRQGHPQPVVLLNSGLIVYVDPPDGIDRPDGLTYLSRAPWRRWDPKDDDTWPAKVLPAEDYLRACLEEALDRYRAFGE